MQPSEQEGERSVQPSEQEAKVNMQSMQPSEQEGQQSMQPSEQEGEQFMRVNSPSEPEPPQDIFSLVAEVQRLRKVVIGLERQPKEYKDERAKQLRKREGENSMQPSEHETADDMFSLHAEIKELTKIALERKRRQKTENETLKKMTEDIKQINIEIQHLIQKKKLEPK